MSDITLVLDHKKLVATTESQLIRIDQPGFEPQKIPLKMIGRVIVAGAPMVACSVWRALAQHNIPTVILPARGQGAAAFLGTVIPTSVERRLVQYRAVTDDKLCLAVAQWLLTEKLKGQEANLAVMARRNLKLDDDIERIRTSRRKLREDCRSESLMGHEGAAASQYYKALAKVLPARWKFKGRNRRPPRDPVNGLLSLSYVLCAAEVRQILFKKGLDPALGFLHALHQRRDNLVLDILEPLRPKTDMFVFGLLDNPLNLNHFSTNTKDGCRLRKNGRKWYYAAWSEWLIADEAGDDLRQAIKAVVRELIGFLPDQKGCPA